jgi:Bifunctional DNA primase/polymerase, N-terminal
MPKVNMGRRSIPALSGRKGIILMIMEFDGEGMDFPSLLSRFNSDEPDSETLFDLAIEGLEVFDAAFDYVMGGLSVIPIRADGSKAPALRTWTRFQERQPAEAELEDWFDSSNTGIAIICGAVSRNLEVMHFDQDADLLFSQWSALVEAARPDLLARLPVVVTPSGGRHVYYRCPNIEGDLKHDHRAANRSKDKKAYMQAKPLIETLGAGNYVIAPPSPSSCHPFNRTYRVRRGRLNAIPTISERDRESLIASARLLTC